MTSYGKSSDDENFTRSFTFFNLFPDILPIVQFHVDEGIEPEEAIRLIGSESRKEQPEQDANPRWEEETNQEFQTLQLTDDQGSDAAFRNENDPFVVKEVSLDEDEYRYRPITVDRSTLRKLQLSEVFVAKDFTGTKFYRDFHNEQSHAMCPDCHKVCYHFALQFSVIFEPSVFYS